MELVTREYNQQEDTPYKVAEQPTTPKPTADWVGFGIEVWELFNLAAMRVFLILGLAMMLQILHNGHGMLFMTIPMVIVACSVIAGELVKFYSEIDVIWENIK